MVIKDVDNIVVFKKSIDWLRVHIFLAELDGDFEQIYKKILRKEQVPDLEECYSFVRHEAVHHNTSKGKFENLKAFSMVVRNQLSKIGLPKTSRIKWGSTIKAIKEANKSTYKSTHCN